MTGDAKVTSTSVAFAVRAVNAAGVVSGDGGDTVGGVTTNGRVEVVGASGLPAASASAPVAVAPGAYDTAGVEPRASSDDMTSMTEPEPESVSGAEASGCVTHVPAPAPARIEEGAVPSTVQSATDVVPVSPSLNVTMTCVVESSDAEAMVGAIPSRALMSVRATALPSASASVGAAGGTNLTMGSSPGANGLETR
ncbi:MAG: hypothetical protein OXU61_06705 [Gammaproteobacteria bacterium]|nr:hypothetical protein [Gammaproteobacteria bacterium]